MTSSAARWFRPVAIVALALALVLPLAACGKKGKGEGSPAAAGNGAKPAAGGALDGDVLALLTPPGPLTDDLIQRLSALRIKQLWLLAGTLSADGEKWRPAPPPTLKYRLPLGCFVVVRPSWQKSLAGGGAAAGEEVAGRLGEAAAALRAKGNEVRAAHVVFVDGDLSPADLKAFVEGLRKGLAGKIDGSVSLSLPSEFYRQEGAPASLDKVDFIVPLLLGTPASVVGEAVARYPNPAAPTAVEAAGKPYLAGFWLAGGGLVLDDSGVVQKELPESALDRFTEIPQTKITLGGAFEMESGYTYRLFPPKATTVLGVAVPAGAEARFRGVTPSELVATLGDLSRGDWKGYRGRVYFATDFPENDGAIGVESLEDAVSGHRLAPDPAVFVDELEIGKKGGAVTLSLVNRNRHPSMLSQMNNIVELRVPPGSLLSVDPGRFDRYELWLGEGASAKPVTPARADRIRFFEFFVAPHEKVTTGPIRLAGNPAKISLAVSYSIIGADGSELTAEPSPAQPTPPESAAAAPAP